MLSEATNISSSVRVYRTATAYMPTILTVNAKTKFHFLGSICNVVDTLIHRHLNLERLGGTCGSTGQGNYTVPRILVYPTGNLTTLAVTPTPVTLNFQTLCLFPGGSMSPTFSLQNQITDVPGNIIC